jgi:hypothetical protein
VRLDRTTDVNPVAVDRRPIDRVRIAERAAVGCPFGAAFAIVEAVRALDQVVAVSLRSHAARRYRPQPTLHDDDQTVDDASSAVHLRAGAVILLQ